MAFATDPNQLFYHTFRPASHALTSLAAFSIPYEDLKRTGNRLLGWSAQPGFEHTQPAYKYTGLCSPS